MLGRSRILLALALVVGLLLPTAVLPGGPAQAAACADAQTNPVLVGGFEIDGNLCSNTTGTTGPREWDSVGGQPVASDPRAQADGTAFSGTSEDDWPWTVPQTSGSNPSGNADITAVFGYSQVSNDHVYAYFGWERADIQGTAGFFVELNQKPNLHGPVPDRTDGDLRLRFRQQGSSLLTLDAAYLWTSTGPTSGTWDAISLGPYQARVNASSVSNLPGLAPDPMPAGTFAEAAVDLTALFAGAGECSGHLGYLNLRSTSSPQATHPPLQDWVEPVRLGVPSTCPTVVLRKQWINGADGDTASLSINNAATAPGTNTSTAGGQASFLDTAHQATAEVPAGSTVDLGETLGAGNTGTYTTSLSCDNGPLTTPSNGTSGSFVMPPDAGAGDTVTCTVRNTRTSATLTLTKVWNVATPGDAVDLSIEAGHATTGPTVSTAPASTTISSTVLSGEDVTVVEEPHAGNTASYRTTTTCTGIDGFTGAEFGASFVVPPNPGPMGCTITNDAVAAQITLFKYWVHGAEGDTAGLTLTDGTLTDTAAAHVPPGGSGVSAEAASVPILPGDSVTLSEVLPAAGNTNTGLYHPASLTCNGQDVPFTSSTTGAQATATATYRVTSSVPVTCTITNQPRYRVVLTKLWGANAVPGDRAHLTVANTTAGTTGTQTAVAPDPPSAPASVLAAGGNHIVASETLEGSGTYASVVACDHGARTTPGAGASTSLTVPTGLTAGTTIVCTATNLARYRVTLTKAWHGDVVAGDAARLTVHNIDTGRTGGPATALAPRPPASIPSVTASAGDLIELRETRGVADIGTYDHRLACTAGAFTTPSATTTGQFEVPDDLPAGTTVACTLTNTARPSTPGAHAARPRVRTVTTHHRVTPGRAFRDRIKVSRLAAGHRALAVARLYGPFPSRAAASCTAAHQVRERRVTVRNGWTATSQVRVHVPGVYTWRVTVLPSEHNRRATHPCGQAAETTMVAKPGYAAPGIDGGLDGTLDSSSYRKAPVALSMPAIGLRALVRPEGIAAGSMTLPRDVGEVGWLTRSAGAGDVIGTTVIGGHVSDRHDRPGALHDLDRARVGQVITIRQGRTTHRFAVTRTHLYRRGARLPQGYFATTGRHRLVLVNCTDRVVHADGRFHYTRSLVVEARLLT